MATTGERIKELRIKNNMTQEELGEKLGLVKSTISLYENNKSTPDDEIKNQMATLFDVTLDYLMGRSSNPQLTRRNELDIEKDLKDMKKQLEEGTLRMDLGGEPIDEEIMQFIIDNMENTLILAKIKAKEKFTPRKYKK